MNCYISRNYKGTASAGNKAKTDIECVMQNMGFKNIGLKQTTYRNSIISFILTLLSIIKTILSIRKKDIVIIQYPFKKYFSFLCKMIHLRGGKIIVIIHDLGSFRRKRLTCEQEISRLNKSDYIIAHNEKMKSWLSANGCIVNLETLKIFDYLSKTSAHQNEYIPNSMYSVLYAGALRERKNRFLYDWGEYATTYKINLYGNGFEIEKAKNVNQYNYFGFVESDKLIETAKGNFGLVWDGDSLDECSGNFGEYLKINNPHKVSLYIRCNLPIIIWEDAALADFVRENKIGFCIKSLKDLESILSAVTPTEYAIMKNNIKELSSKLQAGYFITNAINKGINAL